MDVRRTIVADAARGIIAALPEEQRVVVSIDDLPRHRFDVLRRGAEPMRIQHVLMATVELGANVWLELSTQVETLRSVS